MKENIARKVEIEKELIKDIINAILSQKSAEKIAIFGSRAKGASSKTSDIDIAVFGREWTDTDINLAKNRIEESIRTPLKFDLVNFYCLTNELLKKDILEKGKSIYGK